MSKFLAEVKADKTGAAIFGIMLAGGTAIVIGCLFDALRSSGLI